MSKSLGNFFTVRDLLDQGIPGEVIRFVLLSTHYSKPMDWTADKAARATETLSGWFNLTQGATEDATGLWRLIEKLGDDLNTAGAIGELHEIASNGTAGQLKAGMRFLGFPNAESVDWFRGHEVWLSTESDGDTPLYHLEIAPFLQKWQNLRMAKDYEAADRLKAELSGLGLTFRNSKDGPCAMVPFGFDPKRLAGLK